MMMVMTWGNHQALIGSPLGCVVWNVRLNRKTVPNTDNITSTVKNTDTGGVLQKGIYLQLTE